MPRFIETNAGRNHWALRRFVSQDDIHAAPTGAECQRKLYFFT
jgi:hypothetical protein